MSTPVDDRHCPRCFAPLRRSESPEGLCPKCLLAVGMGEDAVIRTRTGAPVPAPPALADLQPHFEGLDILSLIGRGGAGAVYRATQRDLGRQVALKVLLLDPEIDPAFGERFVREARAMASLTHPNIATVHDAGRAGPYWYLVMEFVDGPNLRQLIQSRDLAPGEALDVVRQICDALEYAHGEGVVHRDIKPENVLLDARGRVKLVDFGLAKLLGGAPGLHSGGATLTRSSQAMGTWHYMAPEQLRRPLEVDHRADIYSLGVVLYELLTGEVPQGRYAPASQRSRADRRVDAIVDRALEQDPTRRYQEASGVRDDVVRVQSDPDPDASTERGDRDRRRPDGGPQPGSAGSDRPEREPVPAPKAPRSFLSSCLLVILVVFLLLVFGAVLLTMWAAPSPTPTSTGGPVSVPVLSPGPARLAAELQSVYPAIDVTDAAMAAWNRYRIEEGRHTELAAFRSEDRVWAQVDIRPFPEERARLIDAMLQGLDPDDRLGRHVALRARIDELGLLESGERMRTFEVTVAAGDRVDVVLDGEPYEQSVPVVATAHETLRPVMRQLQDGETLRRLLDEAEQLPWTREQLGVRSAPAAAYRALADWWSDHLELEEQHTSSRVESDPAAMVFEIAPFLDEIEAGRTALRASMTAAIGPAAWGDLEARIDWNALAPLGMREGDRVIVEWLEFSPCVKQRSGLLGELTYKDRCPWHLGRFFERARSIAPLGQFEGGSEDARPFDLDLILPDASALLGDDDRSELRSIALRYRSLEGEAHVGGPRHLRAGGGGLGLGGWPLGNVPEAKSCSVMATIDGFPVERAALEARLLTRLTNLPVRIDGAATERVVRALLPFGERKTRLVRDRIGDVQALIAIDAETQVASLAWIGRTVDWRVERFLEPADGPVIEAGEYARGACLSQAMLDGAADGVIPPGLDLRVPGEGAKLLLSGMPAALQSDRAAVELAEASWAELVQLMEAHARWTRWTRDNLRWAQLDVDAFPAERQDWLTRSAERAATPELGAAFAESLAEVDSLLPGRHASAELARLDGRYTRTFEGAHARRRAIFEALEGIGEALPTPDEIHAFDARTIEAVWPYADAPPAASIQTRILAIREEYVALETAAVRPFHDVGGDHDLELRVDAFPEARARLIGELRAIRKRAIDARGSKIQKVDRCDHVVPFGQAPGSVHLTFVDGNAVVTEVRRKEGVPEGLDPAAFRHLTEASFLTEAAFFCDPVEIGLPADLPPAARWTVSKARREYLALVEQNVRRVRAESPPFPRPEGAVRRLASEGDVLRLAALQPDVDEIASRMASDLNELGVPIHDEAALYGELFPFAAVPVDLAVRRDDGEVLVVVEVLGPAGDELSDELRVRTLFEGADPGWRWTPFLAF